ncbi:cell division control protein 42-like [Pelomyxa schiedti]|nr:cell division control protein 42-like [Pelomyxa schiedti]
MGLDSEIHPVRGIHLPTAVDCCEKTIHFNDTPVTVSFCDTRGIPDYDTIRPFSYSGADLVLVCFSVVRPDSFANVRNKWIPEIQQHCPKIPFLLVGCQIDRRNDDGALLQLKQYHNRGPITTEEGSLEAQHLNAAKYMECSCMFPRTAIEILQEIAATVSNNNKTTTTTATTTSDKSGCSLM